MDKQNEKRFNEVQPNSEQREEFLIVTEFLQNEAYDKDHATTQANIHKYAFDKYNKEIRRDRIGQILIHLEQISKTGKFSLPFKLEVVELNKIKKYYVSQRQFSENEIVKVLSALQKDKLLSDDETKRMTAKILSVSAPKEKANEIYNKVKKSSKTPKKLSQTASQTYIDFVEACLSNDRLVFKVKDKDDITISGRIRRSLIDSLNFADNESFGYAYTNIELDGQAYAVIYIDEIKQVLVTRIENLEVLRKHERPRGVSPSSFILDDDRCSNIDDWLEKYYSGKYGSTVHFKLKVTINDPSFDFKEFTENYKRYWKVEDFKYETIDREVPSALNDGETIIAKDAVFELDANLSSFRKWYIEKGNFDEVVILEPAHLNDLYLGSRIERYARRLTKYGTKYNYLISKGTKVEFQKELEDRKKRTEARQVAYEVIKNNGITIYLGNDNAGAVHRVDLNKVKNIIGVGTCGSGKSVYLHTILQKWYRRFTPEKLRLCFVDPKCVEFYEYRESPFLYKPVVTSQKDTNALINDLIKLSEERIKTGKIDFRLVVFIDEFADLLWKNESLQTNIASLMKNTDKTGIHFIIMSQRKVYSKALQNAATTKINFCVAIESDALAPINGEAAVNLLGSGDELVFNEELFGSEPKALKVVWDRGIPNYSDR